MMIFEYVTFRITKDRALNIIRLHDLGEKGWELVTIYDGIYYMKRGSLAA